MKVYDDHVTCIEKTYYYGDGCLLLLYGLRLSIFLLSSLSFSPTTFTYFYS